MKLFLGAEESESIALVRGLRMHWSGQRFCDVTLQSKDGSGIKAHRVVLASASEALAALVGDNFAEGQGGPITLDASEETLKAVIGFIYGERIGISPMHVSDVLRFAHLYNIHGLQHKLVETIREHLDQDGNEAFALQILLECELLQIEAMEMLCEQYVAMRFDVCRRIEAFNALSASQLGRVIKHIDINVPCEEVILQAVLDWRRAAPGRDTSAVLLCQSILFHLMAWPSLHVIHKYAQKAGIVGVDLQKEASRAMQVHHAHSPCEDMPPAKRRCFRSWCPGWGSSVSPSSSVVVASFEEEQKARAITVCADSLFVSYRSSRCVVRWPWGASSGQIVAGRNSPVNEVDFSEWVSIGTMGSGSTVLLADRNNHRVFRLMEGNLEVLGRDQWNIHNPHSIYGLRTGAVYVLDEGGTRVQKFENDLGSVVAGGNGRGSALNQFIGSVNGMHVTDSGNVYVCDKANHRVVRWAPGTDAGEIVAGGCGPGSGPHELNDPAGISVTAEETVYVADSKNRRVMQWLKGAREGSVVLDDIPATDVACDDAGALYVLEAKTGHVRKFGPPPSLLLIDEGQ